MTPETKTKFTFAFKKRFHIQYNRMEYPRDGLGGYLINDSAICDTYKEAVDIITNNYDAVTESDMILIGQELIDLYGYIKQVNIPEEVDEENEELEEEIYEDG